MAKLKSKRILIFNVNWLGDVLFSSAAIRNIRYNYPGSYIACVIPPRCYPVLKDNPHLDEIFIFDEKDRHKGIISKLRFASFLRQKKFDIVFLLHRSFTRALITYLAGVPERIGYYTKKRGFLLTKKILPPQIDSLHRIDYYLTIPEKAGLKIEDRFIEFIIKEQDENYVEDLLKKQGVREEDFLIAINPGGNWYPKRWPKENFSALLKALVTDPKVKVIITGGHNDLKLVEEIVKAADSKAIIAAGKFNLKQLGALLKKVNIFISADTGPLHIANAVGVKNIIALFGPTSSKVTGPYPQENVHLIQKDVGCRIPCYEVNCKDNRCMKAISVDEVLKKIKEALSRKL